MENIINERLKGLGYSKESMKGVVQTLREKIMPEINKMKEEFKIISTPKENKNETFKGKDLTVHRLTDGRIFLRFASMDDSKFFYDNMPVFSEKEVVDLLNKQLESVKGYPWYVRLFKKF